MLQQVTKLIVVEVRRLHRGRKGHGRPSRLAEETPGPPPGKRSTWNGNQLLYRKAQKRTGYRTDSF